jgi:hypothetical protein
MCMVNSIVESVVKPGIYMYLINYSKYSFLTFFRVFRAFRG